MDQNDRIEKFLATPQDILYTHMDVRELGKEWNDKVFKNTQAWAKLVAEAMVRSAEATVAGSLGRKVNLDDLNDKVTRSVERDMHEYSQLGAVQTGKAYIVGYQEGTHANTKDFAKTMIRFIDEGVLPDGTGEWRKMMEHVSGIADRIYEEQFAGQNLNLYPQKKS